MSFKRDARYLRELRSVMASLEIEQDSDPYTVSPGVSPGIDLVRDEEYSYQDSPDLGIPERNLPHPRQPYDLFRTAAEEEGRGVEAVERRRKRPQSEYLKARRYYQQNKDKYRRKLREQKKKYRREYPRKKRQILKRRKQIKRNPGITGPQRKKKRLL